MYDNLQDAEKDHDKKKLVDRAKRALELAEEDPALAEACRIVREVIEAVESELACA